MRAKLPPIRSSGPASSLISHFRQQRYLAPLKPDLDLCAAAGGPGSMASAMVTDDPDQLLLNPPDPNLICPVCLKLFSQPVRTACG